MTRRFDICKIAYETKQVVIINVGRESNIAGKTEGRIAENGRKRT